MIAHNQMGYAQYVISFDYQCILIHSKNTHLYNPDYIQVSTYIMQINEGSYSILNTIL